jgi:polyisoprenoid-binding protein YceI
MAITHYDIDPSHSGALFKVRHMMISNVRGEFTRVSGTVDLDTDNPSASSINVTIQAASINTHEEKRDEHLRSADFLDVAKYPSITFKSTGVAATGEGYEVTGNLTIHGVTGPVNLMVEDLTPEAKDPWGGFRRGATATAKIDRKDFGMKWNAALEAGGILVGEEVHINIDVQLVRKA